MDDEGRPVRPEKANGVKFELFVFDALPFARNPVVVETSRADDFSPVKNAEGVDSPATCRADQLRQFARWLRAAGAEVGDGPDRAPGGIAGGFAAVRLRRATPSWRAGPASRPSRRSRTGSASNLRSNDPILQHRIRGGRGPAHAGRRREHCRVPRGEPAGLGPGEHRGTRGRAVLGRAERPILPGARVRDGRHARPDDRRGRHDCRDGYAGCRRDAGARGGREQHAQRLHARARGDRPLPLHAGTTSAGGATPPRRGS